MGSPASDHYYIPLPIWTGGNVFFNGAKPCNKEKSFAIAEHPVELSLVEKEGTYRLKTNLYEFLPETDCQMIATPVLGMAFEPEEAFENPDGTPIIMDEDILGRKRGLKPIPGPFAGKEEAQESLFTGQN